MTHSSYICTRWTARRDRERLADRPLAPDLHVQPGPAVMTLRKPKLREQEGRAMYKDDIGASVSDRQETEFSLLYPIWE